MRRGILSRKVSYLYDYEQEWHDPCSCHLNMKRWRAICALRDTWTKLDASHLKKFLHRDFVYGSFVTKEKLGRNAFIQHLNKKFLCRSGNPIAGRIVNLLRGHVQLDYPYAVQLSGASFSIEAYSTLHIPRFRDDKIIEIYVSSSEDYEFDVSYEKGIVKDNSGKKVDFLLTGILNQTNEFIRAKDLQRHAVNTSVSALERNGAKVDCVDYANKPSSANIMTVNATQLIIYRCDGRLRQQNRFARRTCGPLKDFVDKYGKSDNKWYDRVREYDMISKDVTPCEVRPILAIMTCDHICVGDKNGLPRNGSYVNLWRNEIVRVVPPYNGVRSIRQWINWVMINDGYLKHLSEQAHVAWSADIYARSAPVLLAVTLLPVKLQVRLLTTVGTKYLKTLKDAGVYLSRHAKMLNEEGVRTPGLHRESKRLLLMAEHPRFSVA